MRFDPSFSANFWRFVKLSARKERALINPVLSHCVNAAALVLVSA